MSLPIINEEVSYNKTSLPDGKSIGIRGWKVKDEKELLFALETEEDVEKTKIKHILNFLKGCVDDKNKFNTISENGIKKLCAEIRKLSKGETIPYIQRCPHCDFKFEDSVNITKELVTKNFDTSPIIVNDKLTITIKDLDWMKSEELVNKYEKTPKTFEFYYILNSIDSITYDGTTYTEFTAEEVETYISSLSPDALTLINDEGIINQELAKRTSSCELHRTTKCFKCKKEFEINFGDLLSFLVF